MNTRRLLLLTLALVAAQAGAQQSVPGFVDAMRGPVPITETTRPPLLGNAVNDDQRLKRNYAAQPPIIPHRVDGYQIDKNFNKCLDCHARGKATFSQAVPVSTTHYLDRSGKELPQVSTRRYFCLQCHVAQEAVRPLVGNRFQGLESASDAAGTAAGVALPAVKK
jgi:nitrate reductase (cytochrome), electron transfer subunit